MLLGLVVFLFSYKHGYHEEVSLSIHDKQISYFIHLIQDVLFHYYLMNLKSSHYDGSQLMLDIQFHYNHYSIDEEEAYSLLLCIGDHDWLYFVL